jgi:AcrR family transcriptional regulator
VKKSRPYHHGNLKAALLEAAVKVLGKVGPHAFTLREVARRAAVSHNAPYRHFRDKDELLAAVAAEGFTRLGDTMLSAAAAAGTPLDAVLCNGRGYVQFAVEYPEHFSAMFDRPAEIDDDPAYAQAGRRAFHVLFDNIEAAQKSGQLPGGDPNPLALAAWSMVHGVAKLAVAGRLPFATKEALLEFNAFAGRALTEGLARARVPAGNP